jgi:hypothetical protein
MRQYALIKKTDDYIKIMYMMDDPIMKEDIFIFLGEIPNMQGHCVVAGHKSGKIFSGYHTNNFIELTEDEI